MNEAYKRNTPKKKKEKQHVPLPDLCLLARATCCCYLLLLACYRLCLFLARQACRIHVPYMRVLTPTLAAEGSTWSLTL